MRRPTRPRFERRSHLELEHCNASLRCCGNSIISEKWHLHIFHIEMRGCSCIIVGAGGFGNEVFEYARDASGHADNFGLKGFLDDDFSRSSQLPAPFLGTPAAYQPELADRFVVAVGDSVARERVVHDLAKRGAMFVSLVHPTAYVAATASTDEQGVGKFSATLIPGNYALRVESPGFETFNRNDLVVKDGEITEIAVSLKIAAVTENVTVAAPADEATNVQAGASTAAAVVAIGYS